MLEEDFGGSHYMANVTKLLTGKTCMVTGANAGIGKATALGLAKMGATVVMVCRNRKRGEAALTEIKRESGNDAVSLLLADLSSQAAIQQLAQDFKARYPTLHVLINNAGIVLKKRILTNDKLETQFAVNHLAYFLLTNLLLDDLKASAPARIVNVSSQAHKGVSIDFDDLQSERSYRRTHVYAWTKLANVLFTYELARRLEGTQVTANCLHPGVIATSLIGDYMPNPLRFMTKIIGASPERGARTPLYLATSPEVEGVSGKYFVDRKAVQSSNASYDTTTASRLWRVSAEVTGLPAYGGTQ
ncbi:MAG: SDR family oxidoreductase [candidate division NC10 bacterium]|nr:SDR family oxidoreductase [candidate division NC10 bacterium]